MTSRGTQKRNHIHSSSRDSPTTASHHCLQDTILAPRRLLRSVRLSRLPAPTCWPRSRHRDASREGRATAYPHARLEPPPQQQSAAGTPSIARLRRCRPPSRPFPCRPPALPQPAGPATQDASDNNRRPGICQPFVSRSFARPPAPQSPDPWLSCWVDYRRRRCSTSTARRSQPTTSVCSSSETIMTTNRRPLPSPGWRFIHWVLTP